MLWMIPAKVWVYSLLCQGKCPLVSKGWGEVGKMSSKDIGKLHPGIGSKTDVRQGTGRQIPGSEDEAKLKVEGRKGAAGPRK